MDNAPSLRYFDVTTTKTAEHNQTKTQLPKSQRGSSTYYKGLNVTYSDNPHRTPSSCLVPSIPEKTGITVQDFHPPGSLCSSMSIFHPVSETLGLPTSSVLASPFCLSVNLGHGLLLPLHPFLLHQIPNLGL